MPVPVDLPDSVDIALRLGLIAVVALVAFLAVRAAVHVGVRHLLERRGQEAGAETLPAVELERRVTTVGRLLVRIAGGIIGVVGTLMALDLFGLDIGPAVAGLGVVGIAVGLGAQTLVRDWLAGIFIVLENQFSQGDVVRIAGVEGVVEEFGLRRTTLRDLDGTLHSVPNGQITVASNLTRLWVPVGLDVRLADGTDLDRATSLIEGVGEKMQADAEWGSRMLEAPRVVRANGRGDEADTLKVLGQVRAADQRAVADELRTRILAAFGNRGVEIPVPPRAVGGGDGSGDGDGVAAPG